MFANKDVLEFSKVIHRLSTKEDAFAEYEGLHLERIVEHRHNDDVLAANQPQLPFILASRVKVADDGDMSASASVSVSGGTNKTPNGGLGLAYTGRDGAGDTASPLSDQLGGSPLKMRHFSINSSVYQTPGDCSGVTGVTGVMDSERPDPVHVPTARRLVSLYTLALGVGEVNGGDSPTLPVLPLWVLADGGDRRGTVMIGAWPSPGTGQGSRPATHMLEVTCTGPFSEDSLPKYSSVCKTVMRRSCAKQMTSSCVADYDIFAGFFKLTSASSSGQRKSLLVRLQWQQVAALLQRPPPNAQASVHASVCIDDVHSAAHGMLTELRMLQAFSAGLEGELVQWNYSENSTPIKEKVKLLINKVREGDVRARHDVASVDTDDGASNDLFSVKQLLLLDRFDLDFTDQLWGLLRDCQSNDELRDSLQVVFDHLHTQDLNAMVHRSNTSTLACLIRDSYADKLVLPSMDGTLPLQILVEIGVEKLSADYCNVLIGKELAAAHHLRHLVARAALAERVSRLVRLHHVVETAVMLEHYLDAPQATLISSVRAALLHYECHDVSQQYTFVSPISTSAVSTFIDSPPTRWSVSLSSEVSGELVTSTCLLSGRPPFPLHPPPGHSRCHSVGTEDTVMDGEDPDVIDKYYMTKSLHTVAVMS